jgi:hypothetical protein
VAKLVTQCPSCEKRLTVTQLSCNSCGTQLEGQFSVPALLHLSSEDQSFVLDFVRVSGSLKEMAKLHGHSYPTIRNRLDEIIGKLEGGSDRIEEQRHEILDAIARGEITAEEGAAKLREVGE